MSLLAINPVKRVVRVLLCSASVLMVSACGAYERVAGEDEGEPTPRRRRPAFKPSR